MKSRKELYQTPEYWLERIQNDIFRMVHHYMEEKKYNQTRLAQELGVSKGYISQILNGDFNFSLKKLIELSISLGVAPKIDLEETLQDYITEKERKLEYMNKNGFLSIDVKQPFTPITVTIPMESFKEVCQIA